MSPSYHRRLFILGAGFSKPAGLPLGVDLLESVRNSVRSYFLYRAGWEGTLEQEIEEWKELYPDKPLELERVLAYSHRKHYLRLRGADEYFEQGSSSVIAAQLEIRRILGNITLAQVPSFYRDFAKQLTPNDDVLTFNYDTLLEQIFDEIEIPYTLTPERWLEKRLSVSEEEYIDVLKLHGSIDWYDCQYYRDVMQWYVEQGRNPTDSESLARDSVREGYGKRILSQVFRVPLRSERLPIVGDERWNIVPFILPPAYDKLLGYDSIVDLWEYLHSGPSPYYSVVIIGYSMPYYDAYAYEALGRILIEHQQRDETFYGRRHLPVQLITKSTSKQDALKSIPFLDPSKTRIWHKGFSEDALNWLDRGNNG